MLELQKNTTGTGPGREAGHSGTISETGSEAKNVEIDNNHLPELLQGEQGDIENVDDIAARPTENDLFLAKLGDQLIKDTIPFLNQVVRQMVTLSAALLFGTIAISDKPILPFPATLTAIFFLFASLIISVWAMTGTTGRYRRNVLEEIQEDVSQGIESKKSKIFAMLLLISTALAILAFGFLAKVIG